MLTQSEILSVLEMLRNENLDVRTVTLGLNLLDCASDDLGRFTTKIYDRITQTAERLVAVCDGVGENTAYQWSTKGFPSAPWPLPLPRSERTIW
jgi:uncharacterized protein (UPF0210 family)